MKLTGNSILVTGGTSGIGRGLAEAFHRLGNEIVIAGRRQHLLDEVTAQNPGMRGMQLDVDDPRALAAFAVRVRAEVPTLNVLFNNAGISTWALTAGLSYRLYVTARGQEFLALEPVEVGVPRAMGGPFGDR